MTCAFRVSHWFSLLAGQLSVQMNANSRFSCFILPLLLLLSRLPRNNNRNCVHQHSFMASHYAKRRAKGAWHFLPVGRKIRKNRLRLLFVFFFWSPTMCLDQRHHCLAVVVTRALKQSRRHSKDTLHLKLPGTQHLTRAHISMSNMYRLLSSFPTNSIRTFRYIECIDILRSLVSDFINCIDTWTMKRCSRWAQQLVLLYKLLIYVWKHLLLKLVCY